MVKFLPRVDRCPLSIVQGQRFVSRECPRYFRSGYTAQKKIKFHQIVSTEATLNNFLLLFSVSWKSCRISLQCRQNISIRCCWKCFRMCSKHEATRRL